MVFLIGVWFCVWAAAFDLVFSDGGVLLGCLCMLILLKSFQSLIRVSIQCPLLGENFKHITIGMIQHIMLHPLLFTQQIIQYPSLLFRLYTLKLLQEQLRNFILLLEEVLTGDSYLLLGCECEITLDVGELSDDFDESVGLDLQDESVVFGCCGGELACF